MRPLVETNFDVPFSSMIHGAILAQGQDWVSDGTPQATVSIGRGRRQ
jgi:hypothetical protein